MERTKKLLLAALTGMILIGIGLAPDVRAQAVSPLAFEVASVKPHQFARNEFAFAGASRDSAIQISGTRVTVQGLLAGLVLAAYNLRTFQLSGTPEWRNETGRYQIYDIEARTSGDRAPTMSEVRQMLQKLLAERFQLQFHRETKELPAYDLVIGNNGSKLKPSAPDAESKTESSGRLRTRYTNVPISELVVQIGPQFDRPLLDKTGLQGGYDFALEYMPSLPSSVNVSAEEAAALVERYPADEAVPLATALQQQLGLKVVPTKEQVEILVIDHVEKPTPN